MNTTSSMGPFPPSRDGPAIVMHCPPEGTSVLDHIRKEGGQPMENLLPFLAQAAAAFDHAADLGLRLQAHPRDVMIRFEESGIQPLFTVALPAGMEARESGRGEDPAVTLIAPEAGTSIAPSPARDLATLLYWMVAARMPGDGAYHSAKSFKAIEGLSEPGNTILRSALCGKFDGNCRDLLAVICRVENLPFAPGKPTGIPVESTPPTSIPGDSSSPGRGSGRLRLRGLGPDDSSVAIVADTVFRIGRQRERVDLVARFLPRDAANDSLTRGLSKEHARLEFRDGGIILVDAGSTNGTLWNGICLHGKPVRIEENGEIGLATGVARHFKLEFKLMPAPTPRTNPAVVPEHVDAGCALLVPEHPHGESARYLWLFGQAAVGSQPGLPVVLDDPAIAPLQAIFHRDRQCIWIRNLVGNKIVSIDGLVLGADESARLSHGSLLRIGTREFALESD